jgi:hypothetical protein
MKWAMVGGASRRETHRSPQFIRKMWIAVSPDIIALLFQRHDADAATASEIEVALPMGCDRFRWSQGEGVENDKGLHALIPTDSRRRGCAVLPSPFPAHMIRLDS